MEVAITVPLLTIILNEISSNIFGLIKLGFNLLLVRFPQLEAIWFGDHVKKFEAVRYTSVVPHKRQFSARQHFFSARSCTNY